MKNQYTPTTISSIEGKRTIIKERDSCAFDGLQKFKGTWDLTSAAHLLRRTTFGATGKQIKTAAASSLDLTLSSLFQDIPLPPEPINYRFEDDPHVSIGESFVGKPIERGPTASMISNYRRRAIIVWQLDNLITSDLNIREQMTLFWHNHFVTEMEAVRDASYIYTYITKIRKNATGNFKTLAEQMTIDPAMLRYLNGNQNSKKAPNENYARELLELFTIGKGRFAGEGDYTTFTEEDVVSAAQVLTGWRDIGYFGRDDRGIGAVYINNRHDKSTKNMSHRFGNAQIEDQGEDEYKALINIIFQQDEVAKFICRKLYRWFVYYDITEEVEANIIDPLASMLRDNKYEILPVLKTLLSSEHFFNICSIGPMIKNPITFLVNLLRQNNVSLPQNDILKKYNVLFRMNRSFENSEMAYFNPPNVAGWKAFYQEPLYNRIWISSVTLRARQAISDAISLGQIRIGGFSVTVDLIDYISSFGDPFDPNTLIKEFVANLFPQPITEKQLIFLKEILIPGLPDFEWTVEYDLYLNNPDNEETRQSIDQKLRNFFSALFKNA